MTYYQQTTYETQLLYPPQPAYDLSYQYNKPYEYISLDNFNKIADEYGINEEQKKLLFECLGKIFPVILIDDSGSMTIKNEYYKTRWENQVEYLNQLIPFIVQICGSVDVHFLNRESVMNVKHINEISNQLSIIPNQHDRTPFFTKIREIYRKYSNKLHEKGMLLFSTTDGAPSDFTNSHAHAHSQSCELKKLLITERPRNNLTTKQGNIYISIVLFTTDENDVKHLDDIRDVDPYHIAVTEDYINEKKEMIEIHGKNFKYTMCDYMIQTILTPLDPNTYKKYEESKCCNIL